MVKLFKKKRDILVNLENCLDPKLLHSLKIEAAASDGSQFRPRVITFPGRMKILKMIQAEEEGLTSDQSNTPDRRTIRSSRLSGSVALNMGLDLEMQQ